VKLVVLTCAGCLTRTTLSQGPPRDAQYFGTYHVVFTAIATLSN